MKSFPSFRFQPISTWTRPRLAKCIIGGKKVRALNVQKKSRFQGGRNFQPVLDYNFIGDFVDRDGDLEMKKKKKWARGGSPIAKSTREEKTRKCSFSSLLFSFFFSLVFPRNKWTRFMRASFLSNFMPSV